MLKNLNKNNYYGKKREKMFSSVFNLRNLLRISLSGLYQNFGIQDSGCRDFNLDPWDS